MPASYETHRKQLELILQAWGMPAPTAATTAEIMSWADLHGIDTHGISMVPPYDERRRNNKLDMRAEPKVVKETPVSVLIDGGGGLGHPNARRGMELAIEKAKKTGIGVAAVRNSGHFGACGFYALMAVESDLVGMVTTSASGIQVSPTHGAQARLGTDPIAFAFSMASSIARRALGWPRPPPPSISADTGVSRATRGVARMSIFPARRRSS